eukprot:ANDGO_03319.mRNA.1 hypothetical protein H696_04903
MADTNVPFVDGSAVHVRYLQVRDCADPLSINAKQSLQDNLNKLLETEINGVHNLHRVIQIEYADSASYLRKNCGIATVWYEVLKKVSHK